jgi:hypothetical protein
MFNTVNVHSQEPLYPKKLKNSVHLDCATAFYIGMSSLNYERTFIYSNQYKLMLNTGLGGWYFIPIPKEYYGISVPLSLNNLIGSGNNYFEVDFGIRYTFLNERSVDDKFQYFPIINFGYRFQRSDGNGLIFRSFIGYSGLGIGVGKAF